MARWVLPVLVGPSNASSDAAVPDVPDVPEVPELSDDAAVDGDVDGGRTCDDARCGAPDLDEKPRMPSK